VFVKCAAHYEADIALRLDRLFSVIDDKLLVYDNNFDLML
jgi:hypothetical protein